MFQRKVGVSGGGDSGMSPQLTFSSFYEVYHSAGRACGVGFWRETAWRISFRADHAPRSDVQEV